MNLIRAQEWLAPGVGLPRASKPQLAVPLSYATAHHTVMPTPINVAAEYQQMRDIDKQHRAQGWGGVGYNFVIGPSGNVYEGCGFRIGAHVANNNSKTFGICFMGDFTNKIPTPAAMKAAAELMQHLINIKALRPAFTLRGHRDWMATACPGNKLYPELPMLRRMVGAAPTPGEPVTVPRVNAPVVGGMASYDADGNIKGYILIGADGGIFSFGQGAPYLGRVEYVLPAGDSWSPDAD